MGAGESKPSEEQQPQQQQSLQPPRVLRIERSQIPDAYKSVGVSDEVVRRVNAEAPLNDSSTEDVNALTAELQKEKHVNAKLREQMQNLTALQNRFTHGISAPPACETLEDIEEKKRVFDETIQRVEKQFFSYQRENACADNEKDLQECLSKNKGKVLNCQALKAPYEECIVNFRNQVLASKTS